MTGEEHLAVQKSKDEYTIWKGGGVKEEIHMN